jgi:hypothetical protein
MFTFPAWSSGWAETFGAILFCLYLGKALRQQNTVLMAALIGGVVTSSWVGVFVGGILPLLAWPLDVVRKAGS